ncbi:tetratricopeptide repeat protein [Candidatus Uhrbacteria bacterium]|nr:tetratricopeptide repeat protein [Candidatus Uhrbacteria bacterium]
MMILFWIALVLLIVSLAALVWVAFRHMAQVRVVNIHTDDKAQHARVKEDIILERVTRTFAPARFFLRVLPRVVTFLRRVGRRTVQELRTLEKHYAHVRERAQAPLRRSGEAVKRAMEEAAALVHDEQYAEAEKKYIEVISLRPRHVAAYEFLGRLYTKMGNLDQAVETLAFALQLAPNDASVHVSLGEVYGKKEEWARALAEFERAVAKRPGNPRYLDLYIESALIAKRPEEAARGIALLRKTNKENQKLGEFDARLAALQGTM